MSDKLTKRARKAKLDTMQRHVLVCTDDDCGGSATAKALRKAIDAEGLRTTVSVARTGCMKICTKGTIAVVYPDGVWYAGLKPGRVQRLVTEHLRDGNVIEEWVFHTNTLAPGARAPEGPTH